jgi:dTDP-4-dehydrorhamnose reductase
MKLAVIGPGGQVGSEVVAAGKGAGMDVLGLMRADCDVTDPASLARAFAPLHEGDVVVNTAAFHKTDECEERPDEAVRVNAAGAFACANAARARGAAIVFISTDAVFDGAKRAAYVESDAPQPLGVYGATKAAGEALVAATNPIHFVARIASVFGVAGSSGKGGNFVETMLRFARDRERPSVVADVVMSPTSASDAAKLLVALIERDAAPGTYHIANQGACSWREFADAIFEEVGSPVRAVAVPSAAKPSRAPRPAYSALASEKLAALGLEPRPWRIALREYLRAKGHIT